MCIALVMVLAGTICMIVLPGMIYMSSVSTNNGDSIITVTFDVGYDQDVAQMELLTRSSQALPGLPPEVNQVGLTIPEEIIKHASDGQPDLAQRHP